MLGVKNYFFDDIFKYEKYMYQILISDKMTDGIYITNKNKYKTATEMMNDLIKITVNMRTKNSIPFNFLELY